MARLYLELDEATKMVASLFDYTDPIDKEWLRNELEQACEIRVCELCRDVNYTASPFKVTTQTGNLVEAVFNFCPVCGKDLRPETTDIWGG